MKIVEVVWLDSQAHGGWTDKNEMQEWNGDMLCKSVGYLVRKENDRIVLAMSESSTSLADGLTIPRACITNLRRLMLAPSAVLSGLTNERNKNVSKKA